MIDGETIIVTNDEVIKLRIFESSAGLKIEDQKIIGAKQYFWHVKRKNN